MRKNVCTVLPGIRTRAVPAQKSMTKFRRPIHYTTAAVVKVHRNLTYIYGVRISRHTPPDLSRRSAIPSNISGMYACVWRGLSANAF